MISSRFHEAKHHEQKKQKKQEVVHRLWLTRGRRRGLPHQISDTHEAALAKEGAKPKVGVVWLAAAKGRREWLDLKYKSGHKIGKRGERRWDDECAQQKTKGPTVHGLDGLGVVGEYGEVRELNTKVQMTERHARTRKTAERTKKIDTDEGNEAKAKGRGRAKRVVFSCLFSFCLFRRIACNECYYCLQTIGLAARLGVV